MGSTAWQADRRGRTDRYAWRADKNTPLRRMQAGAAQPEGTQTGREHSLYSRLFPLSSAMSARKSSMHKIVIFHIRM